MKISIFTKSVSALGGVEIVVDKHCEWLLKSNNEITILSLIRTSYDKFKSISYKNINQSKIIKCHSLLSKYLGIDFLKNAHRLYLTSDITLIHLPFTLGIISLFYYFLISKADPKSKLSKLYIYHHAVPSNKLIVALVYRLLLKLACRILPKLNILISSNSLDNKKLFRNLINPTNEIAIPYENDLTLSKEFNINKLSKSEKSILTRTKNYINNNRVNGIYIGRISYYKGIKYLLKAIPLIDSKIGIIVIGDGAIDNIYKHFNKRELELLNERALIINSYISSQLKNELLIYVDFFLFPSITKSEAYGIAQLDALYNGLPVVNTKLDTGVNLIAKDMIHGCTVPRTKSKECLAKTINKIYKLIINDSFNKNSLNKYVKDNYSDKKIEQIFLSTLKIN